MKKSTILLTIIFIITVLALLWGHTLYADGSLLSGIIYRLLVVLFAIGATWFLYRKEWCQVLGLKTKGITAKVIWKAIAMGLLINIICSSIIKVVYSLILKEKLVNSLGELGDTLMVIPLALILAPLMEELLFRGFVQGLWQKLYSNNEKTPIKLIIVVTALLFAISHFGFLFNVSVKQFLITSIAIFIIALYQSWLRQKYQSIIPSIFAHFGFNSAMVVAPLIMFILPLSSSDALREMNRQQRLSQYMLDTIPYNFDPNDTAEWKRSYEKFAVLEKSRSEEIIKHLKGDSISLPVHFKIDTCGYIHSIYVFKSTDTIWVKKSWGKPRKYTAEDYYIQEYGYDFMEEAIKFIKSLPQCKPYIENGKKVEKEMEEQVQFY
ncbi:MAG: CPBP family intramembrane metalloprotease [Lentimicrobiaceae bacterium]|nr:CPBP family intramembrane metalloprotease [Lentimicrobiaceae bacterium]